MAEEHEAQLQAVVLIRTASLPKTSSGKVRRRACRAALPGGGARRGRAPAEAEGAATGVVTVPLADDLSREEGARDWLAGEVAARAGVPRAAVNVYEPLHRFALDSLNVMELAHAVEERLGVPVPMETFFEGASVATVVARAFAARALAPPAAAAAAAAEPERPLSHGQRALWLLYLLDPESSAYNVPGLVTIEGEVDAGALRRAFQAIVDRHPNLRSTFSAPQGEPVRRVHDGVDVPFFQENVARWTEAELARQIDEEANRPFDLEAGLPLRVYLFERSRQERVLLVVAHHIATDFWSQGVMLQELDALYPAARAGEEGSALPPAPPYIDFVRWQREMLAGAAGAGLRAYWRERLAGELPVLDLPVDRPRPPFRPMAARRGGCACRWISRRG